MRKRVLAFLTIVALAMSVGGCGGGESSTVTGDGFILAESSQAELTHAKAEAAQAKEEAQTAKAEAEEAKAEAEAVKAELEEARKKAEVAESVVEYAEKEAFAARSEAEAAKKEAEEAKVAKEEAEQIKKEAESTKAKAEQIRKEVEEMEKELASGKKTEATGKKDTKEIVIKNAGEYDKFDNVVYVEKDVVTTPYYVGKQKESFLKSLNGYYDRVVYLGTPMYLPEIYKNATSFALSDTTVATIEGNVLVPLTQGRTYLTGYDAKGKELTRELLAVTTFNDNKDVITAASIDNEYIGVYFDLQEAAHWKDMIHTITDLITCLEIRGFVYEGVEPEFCGIDNWQWTADADAIFDYNKGVCVQIAQVANYMLAEDYEDWGNIIVFGKQGHIFNWFYEDGYYYIFDFTQVISDNRDRRNGMSGSIDYTNNIKKFSRIDEIKTYIQKEKVEIDKNYLVCMYSCQGHDYMPAWLDGGMNGSDTVYTKTTPTVFAFEDIVHDEMIVLWQDPKCKIETEGVVFSDMPDELKLSKCALYGKEMTWFYEYE